MKKLNKKNVIRIVSDALLVAIISAVFVIGFYYKSVMPLSVSAKNQAVYHGNTEKKQISLMFNVYENSDVVCSILDELNKYGAKATFFVGGCWADDNAPTLKKIVESGNEIANHGYFHKDHKKLDYESNANEISQTSTVIEALCGVSPKLFAPPSGSFSDKTLDAATDLGYKVIMWSKDTIDWRDNDEELIFKRATLNLKNGDLVLMHPKNHTLSALPRILSYYVSNGYKVVSVSENIK